MKIGMKSRRSRFLILIIFVVTAWTTAVAENGDKEAEKKEVLTPLEQKMQKRIDKLAFSEEGIDNVIAMIAQYADIDIIKSPDVTGTITATLTDVPVEEALTNILAAHNYGYIKSENMIRIVPLKEITEKPEPMVSRIYRITYADVTEVEKTLTKFISRDGSLSSIVGTSNIIVTDRESRIKAIDTLIAEIDRITPQISVEARIYDITSKDKFDLGVEWQAGRNTVYQSGTPGTTDGTGLITGLGTNPTKDRDPFMTGIFQGATGKTSGTTGVLRLGWLNTGIDIDTMLRAQQNKIDAKLLANPRVLVLDNETALIKIISEIPYQELTESAEGGTIGTTSFKEVGVELLVTPHLTRDDMIRLKLQPKFSVKVDEVTFVGTVSYPQPVIDRREANTTLLIKNGQTVVLGGLRKKDVTKQVNKIPLLGDIPLVGALFRFEGEDTVISELVVFITPKLVISPVMTEAEQKAYKATEFSGPEPAFTRAEKALEKAKK